MYKQVNSKKIIFHDFKVEIIEGMKGYVYYYGDIEYITYDNPYYKVHCIGNKSHYISCPLYKLLEILPDVFFQSNKSVIINLSRMKSYDYKTMKIVMDDEYTFSLSSRRKDNFMKLKESIVYLTAPFQSCFSCDSENNRCDPFRAKSGKNQPEQT
jgi:DNA-binding LytR/AlgR family response regulator